MHDTNSLSTLSYPFRGHRVFPIVSDASETKQPTTTSRTITTQDRLNKYQTRRDRIREASTHDIPYLSDASGTERDGASEGPASALRRRPPPPPAPLSPLIHIYIYIYICIYTYIYIYIHNTNITNNDNNTSNKHNNDNNNNNNTNHDNDDYKTNKLNILLLLLLLLLIIIMAFLVCGLAATERGHEHGPQTRGQKWMRTDKPVDG